MPIQEISLSLLTLSDLNVRKTRTKEDVEAMAASIEAHGVLQNLLAHPTKDGNTAWVIGGTRLEAMKLLQKQGKINVDYAVPVELRDANDPTLTERSLSENFRRSSMHPADEFDAFKKLADEGHGSETIAARFGTTTRLVEQRLKLAVVSPKLIAAYRKDEMTLEQLMAFTVSGSHKVQERTWRDFPQWAKDRGDADTIRDQLTEKHIDASTDALAKFVTVAAYEEAGGAVVRDLFADEDEPGYLTDAKLLTRLADAKLKAIAEPIKAEGWKWVEIRPDFDWSEQQKFARVTPAPSKEQQAEIAALSKEQDELYERHADEDGNLTAKQEARSREIEQQLGEIRKEVAFSLAQKAVAGVVITIGRNGEAEIKRGLVKPEDKRAAAKAEATAKPAKESPQAKGDAAETSEPGLSVALKENLTAHRTAALQAKLATNPKVALVAVTHALALSVLERSGYSTVQITGRQPNLTAAGEELAKTAAAKEFAAATREATKGMPRESGKLWTWLLQQDQRRLLSILAVAAAHTVDAVEKKFNGADRAHADQLADALKLDMGSYWNPTAEGFFSRVSKEQTLSAVAEAAGDEIARGMAGLKKAELATAAEKAIRSKGWLPAILQHG